MKIFDPKLTGSIEILNTITGNVTIAGGLNVEGSLGGAVTASATASYVEFGNIANKPTLISSSNQLADSTIDGDLTVTGTLTAQEFHTEFVSASIIYESGSTQFGDTEDDTHVFTGDVRIDTGELYLDRPVYNGTADRRIRLLESLGDSGFQGGYIYYNGDTNLFQLGTHEVTDDNVANDIYTIQMTRGTGNVEINNNITAGAFVKRSGTSSQFLKADGSVDANEYVNISGGTMTGNLTVEGSVGIGTTNPTEKVHIQMSNSASLYLLETGESSTEVKSSGTLALSANPSSNIIFRGWDAGSGVTEKMRITTEGRVGINNDTPSTRLHIIDDASNIIIASKDSNNSKYIGIGADTVTDAAILTAGSGTTENVDLVIRTAASGAETEKVRIKYNGKVGIGTNEPAQDPLHLHNQSDHAYLHITNGTIGAASTDGTSIIVLTDGRLYIRNREAADTLFHTNNIERMRITSDGYVGIGNTSPDSKLHIQDGDITIRSLNTSRYIRFTETAGVYLGAYINYDGSTNDFFFGTHSTGDANVANDVRAFRIDRGSPDVTFLGNISKNGGTFNIEHPLQSKAQTHRLVHSFVESPQANNIYRGRVNLVDGQASINLDTVSNMTEGTFVALNTDIHSYVSNESNWDAVRSSVNGNILTIECQNTTSTATVTWLVIGERHDKHMMETTITDENGRIIVEPEI